MILTDVYCLIVCLFVFVNWQVKLAGQAMWSLTGQVMVRIDKKIHVTAKSK